MVDFVLKDNFFEFNSEVKQQKSGTAIGTKFAPPYARIFMDEVETEFLKSQQLQPFLWLRYIDDKFFVWTHGEGKLTQFLNELNNFHSNLKFTYETPSCTVNFPDLNVSLRNGAIHTDLTLNLQTVTSTSTISLEHHPLLIRKGFQNACLSSEGMVFS